MSDHRENIYEASRSYTARTRDALDYGNDDASWDQDILDVAHFECRTSDAYRTEFVLAVGGPTVWVVVDSRWSDVTFHHSWGMCPHSGDDLTECSMHPDDAELWRTIADDYREVWGA